MHRFTTILTALTFCVLALYCVAGLFAYPLADDLHFIELAKMGNPIAEQYAHWHGRYGYSLLMGVVMPLAPNLIVRVMPSVLIVSMVLMLYKLLGRWVANPLLAASGVTLGFMLSLPSVWQSWMWYGASTNYILPLALIGALFLWLFR